MDKRGITIEREILLFEIERRCAYSDCKAKNSIGLTKAEAREYDGFDCVICERRNDDQLSRKDVPEWWEELTNGTSTNNREQ